MRRTWSLLLLLLTAVTASTIWGEDFTVIPNPQGGHYSECGLKTMGYICDPDTVLSEGDRYRLNHDLQRIEALTRQDQQGSNFCEKKGLTAGLLIIKKVKGGTEEAVKTLANNLLKQWNLDSQCNKGLLIILAVEDHVYWVARLDKTPVYADELKEIFDRQATLLKQGDYQLAMTNALKGISERAVEKQGSGGGGGGAVPGGGGSGSSAEHDSSGTSLLKKIALALIGFVLLTTCCCCCCIYFCCCRKSQSADAAASTDLGERGVSQQFTQGVRYVRTAQNAAQRAVPLLNQLREQPEEPVAEKVEKTTSSPNTTSAEGGGEAPRRGLYPSAAVKDEGGGGQW